MARKELKDRQKKNKDSLKEFEYLLTPEQKKLSNVKKNKIIIDLISKSKKERNEAIQNANSIEVEDTEYKTKHIYRVKKMKIEGREVQFHTDFDHEGNI